MTTKLLTETKYPPRVLPVEPEDDATDLKVVTPESSVDIFYVKGSFINLTENEVNLDKPFHVPTTIPEAETWEDYDHVDARILEIGDDWVRMDCLIDRNSREFEERTFERLLVEGAGSLYVGKYVVITIRRRTGKQVVTFHDGEKTVNRENFEDYSMFENLLDDDLQKPLD